MKKISNLLMMALLAIGMGLTSCDEQLDNAVNPGVMPVVDEDPSVTGVTTFSELQTALSAGKDVKLMNDIVCTAEIEITSGALTIDGNGKKLSTTSAIRAFKVGSSATVAFKNLTLTGFVNEGGPAINNSGTIVLDGCTISNCHVNNTNGGGAIENKGKLYAINTTFSGNYSGEIGGAINNYNGSLYMSGCTFTDNYTTQSDAYYGGAIGINGGTEVRLINCSFSENKYGTATGPSDIGVYWKPTSYTIAGCTGAAIASRDGGAITTNTTGTATLNYSDLSNISFTYTPVPTASTLAESTVGMIVGSDGKAYAVADKDNLPSGTTAEAYIAYKSATAGESRAIALTNDVAFGTSWDAFNLNPGWNSTPNRTSIDNCTWQWPTKADFENMLAHLKTLSTDNGVLEDGCVYMSSTTYEQNNARFWNLFFKPSNSEIRLGHNYKNGGDLNRTVRAVLAF